jgi:iron complex transport system permease protein
MTGKGVPYPVLLVLLALLAAMLALLSMLIGPAAAGTFELLQIMQHGQADTAWPIMREVRLPRTILAAIEGASLGIAGASLQGLLRNPLADPSIVGVSAGASLFAVLALYTGLSAVFPLALPLAAIAGAFVSVAILQGLAGRGGMLTLILAGVAITYLSAAIAQLALNLSPNPYAATEIMFWMMGSVSDRSMDHVALAAPFMVVGWVMLIFAARALDALSLGEQAAASLGVDLQRTRTMIVAGCAMCVGAGTAVTGGIGFVGLVVPHLLRPLVGHKPSLLLPASALAGAALLLAADILVRLIATGTELHLGVVTALIGAPFFLWLIFRARAELES